MQNHSRLSPLDWVFHREKGGNAVERLAPELLRTVPHVAFSVFNLAIPNIIAWAALIFILIVAAWARLPRIFGPES
jgi:hypothetical protein